MLAQRWRRQRIRLALAVDPRGTVHPRQRAELGMLIFVKEPQMLDLGIDESIGHGMNRGAWNILRGKSLHPFGTRLGREDRSQNIDERLKVLDPCRPILES